MTLLNPLPDPDQSSRMRALQEEIFQKNRLLNQRDEQLFDLRQQLAKAEEERDTALVAMGALRAVLLPLHNGLKAVFGEMDAAGVAAAAAAGAGAGATDPTTASDHPSKRSHKTTEVWNSWKAKLPSGEGKAIDALLLHGALTTAQLRIHIGCASRTAQNIVAALKSKGLVVKGDGGRVSLKEL